MAKNHLISVIMPCFNAEKWVTKALNSLLQQTYGNIEILIYNDGSQDSSGEILTKFSKAFKNIKVIHGSSNVGIVFGLNEMIRQCQGDFIARMDADDIAFPNRFDEQLSWITHRDVDLCGTWFREFGQGVPRIARWPSKHEELQASLLFQNTICHPTIMGKRRVFEDFPYREDFNLAEDYDFFSRAVKQYQLGNVPSPLLHYRRHPQQATQAKQIEMELITRQIRVEALKSIGVNPSPEEARIHNMIRAPRSITDLKDLISIEAWLMSLLNESRPESFNSIIATQWLRACIRAAPLGKEMREKFHSSPLSKRFESDALTYIDLLILSIFKLQYDSSTFKFIKRIGLSG